MTVDSLETQIVLDLFRATTDLADARVRQERKDSPAHRAAVITCRDEVDFLLDLLLSAAAQPAPTRGRAGAR
jgi:hypothetical protein